MGARRSLLLAGLLAVLPFASAAGQREGTLRYVESLKANTVRVEAAGMTGFGFIVGFSDRDLLLATAAHTLAFPDDPVSEAKVCFFHQPETCEDASVVYFADPIGSLPGLDLAILSVPYPAGLSWRPDAMDTSPAVGEPVWSIGRDREWYIPPRPGSIVTVEPDSSAVVYEKMEVARGVSGAPMVTANGVAGMHVKSAGQGQPASGIEIAAIRGRLEQQVGGQWILLPRQECDDEDGHHRVIAGRSLVVHFDPSRPLAALEAMTRLNCLGAQTLPSPVWSPSDWVGEQITYGSGDLRTARILQAVLASSGRLDTLLGTPQADAEIWIR